MYTKYIALLSYQVNQCVKKCIKYWEYDEIFGVTHKILKIIILNRSGYKKSEISSAWGQLTFQNMATSQKF